MKLLTAAATASLLTSNALAWHAICRGGGPPDNLSLERNPTLYNGWECWDEFLGLDEQVELIPAAGAHAGDGVDTVIQMRDPSTGTPPPECGRSGDIYTRADDDDNGQRNPDGVYNFSKLQTLRQLGYTAGTRMRICVKSYWAYCDFASSCATSGDYCGYYRAKCTTVNFPAPMTMVEVPVGDENSAEAPPNVEALTFAVEPGTTADDFGPENIKPLP